MRSTSLHPKIKPTWMLIKMRTDSCKDRPWVRAKLPKQIVLSIYLGRRRAFTRCNGLKKIQKTGIYLKIMTDFKNLKVKSKVPLLKKEEFLRLFWPDILVISATMNSHSTFCKTLLFWAAVHRNRKAALIKITSSLRKKVSSNFWRRVISIRPDFRVQKTQI